MKLTIAQLFEGPGCFDTTSPEINLVFYLELPDLDMAPNCFVMLIKLIII